MAASTFMRFFATAAATALAAVAGVATTTLSWPRRVPKTFSGGQQMRRPARVSGAAHSAASWATPLRGSQKASPPAVPTKPSAGASVFEKTAASVARMVSTARLASAANRASAASVAAAPGHSAKTTSGVAPARAATRASASA